MDLKRKYYVDPAVQVPVILALIVLVTAEGLFVGWGFSRVIALASNWENPRQVAEFFKALALTLVPLVGVNFVLGVWLSHKVAGPLLRMRQVMAEVTRGNLEVEAASAKGELLHEHLKDLNRMVETLRRLLYRDHNHAMEVDFIMTECREWLAKRKDLSDSTRKELTGFIDGAKSRLSIVNTHFLKGRLEAAAADSKEAS